MKSTDRWAWRGDVAVAEVLADDRAVLALDELVCRAREVNSSMWRASSSAATVRLTYSEPLSESVEGEGEGSEQGAEDQARGMEVLDRADELELGDLVHQVHVVQAWSSRSAWWTESTRT